MKKIIVIVSLIVFATTLSSSTLFACDITSEFCLEDGGDGGGPTDLGGSLNYPVESDLYGADYGKIESPSDIDYFYFYSTEDICLDVYSTSMSVDLKVTWSSPNGAVWDYNSYDGRNFKLNDIVAVRSFYHYFKVSSEDGSIGTYSLYIKPVNCDEGGSPVWGNYHNPYEIDITEASRYRTDYINDRDVLSFSVNTEACYTIYSTGSVDTVSFFQSTNYPTKVYPLQNISSTNKNFKYESVTLYPGDTYFLTVDGKNTGFYTVHFEWIPCFDKLIYEYSYSNVTYESSPICVGSILSPDGSCGRYSLIATYHYFYKNLHFYYDKNLLINDILSGDLSLSQSTSYYYNGVKYSYSYIDNKISDSPSEHFFIYYSGSTESPYQFHIYDWDGDPSLIQTEKDKVSSDYNLVNTIIE